VQQPVLVGERGTQLDAAGRSVDDAADGLDAPGVVVERPVAELQLHVGHVLQGSGRGAVTTGEVEQLVLGHREVDVHLGIVGNGGELGGRTDQSADAERQSADNALGRSLDDRIGEVVGGADPLGLGLRELSLGGEELVLGGREVELRNDLAPEKLLLAVADQLGGGNPGLGGGDVGFGGLKRGLVRHLVDDEERLPLVDLLALGDAKLGNGARNLGIDIYVLPPADGSRIINGNLPVGSGDGLDGVVLGTRGDGSFDTADGRGAAGCDGRFYEFLLHNHLSFYVIYISRMQK